MRTYKVLVVDDSAFMRKLISDIISDDPQFEVIATAVNGLDAVEKTHSLQPDVITMDIEMPQMNGIEALQVIMRNQPTPVIMLSSVDDISTTMKALDLGAVDFIKKPSGSISLDLYKIKHIIIEKCRTAVQSNRSSLQWRAASSPYKRAEKSIASEKQSSFKHIVAIGTSTGGPKALQHVITQLPQSFPAPVLVVQHMPPNFTKSLAERLDLISEIKVVEAVHNEIITAGTVYIAPGGWHMMLNKCSEGQYRIQLSKDEARNGHRPSVDVMFESLIPYTELIRHSIIMTGMGSDGAKGMKALKDAGARSMIAEAMDSCVVYGMPRAAIEMDAVSDIMSLEHIPAKIIDLVVNSS